MRQWRTQMPVNSSGHSLSAAVHSGILVDRAPWQDVVFLEETVKGVIMIKTTILALACAAGLAACGSGPTASGSASGSASGMGSAAGTSSGTINPSSPSASGTSSSGASSGMGASSGSTATTPSTGGTAGTSAGT